MEFEGERVEDALPGRQGRLLFAYLVLHRERPVRRDELLEALWSENAAPPTADALLSAPLSRLRKALGPGRVEGRSELSLVLPTTVWIDWEAAFGGLEQAHAAVAEERWRGAWDAARAALAIAEGGLLPGLEARWIDGHRAELADLRVELLEIVAASATRLGGAELVPAEQAARAAVEAAPFRESARAALIEVLRARGNLADALRAFEDVRTLLREELGATPGPRLLELHEQLLRCEPVLAAAPTALPDRLAAVRSTPLVGRRAALDQLRSARTRETAAVLVTGEAGIGKTRLIAEMASEAKGTVILYGRCDEDQLFPFGPWIELLGTALARVGDDELAALLADNGPQLARLLPELRGRVPGLAASDLGEPESELRQLYAAVVALVQRLSRRQPLTVIIDDLHWADRSSLLLGRHVVRQLGPGPVLLIGSYRDTDLSPSHPLVEVLADLEREGPLRRVRLHGLDHTEIAELADAEGHDVDSATVGAVREQTNGNPFFVKQLLQHLDESQDLRAVQVSAGLRDVIVRRVARLPSEAGRALRVAALMGREFDMRLLEPVTDLPEAELLDHLDAAVTAGILWEVASVPGRYSFVHALVRTALEQELSATRRAYLHRRIGEAIEARYGERLAPWLAELTRHFSAAGPEGEARALDYAVRASEQATGRLAYAEAAGLLIGALTIAERQTPVDEGRRAQLRHDLAMAYWRLGRMDEARATFDRAAVAARRAGAAELFARAALGHSGGAWAWWGAEDTASVHLLEESLALLPEADSAIRAQVLARLGSVLYFSARAERGASLIESAIRMAHRVADDGALATALAAAQWAYWRLEDAEIRGALADELVHVVERTGTPEQVAEALLWRSGTLLTRCRRDEADADIDRYADTARRLDQPELLTHCASLRAMQALLEGRWAQGEQAAEEVLALGSGSSVSRQEHGVAMLVLRGEQLRLAELVEPLEEMAHEMHTMPAWRAPLAWAYAQAERAEVHRVLAELCRDDFAALPRDVNFDTVLGILAHIAEALADAGLAAQIEPYLRPVSDCWILFGIGSATLGPVAYSLGVCSILTGKLDVAVSDFELALRLSRQMRARPYEAHAALGLARALAERDGPGDAERATASRRTALAIADELDMPRLLRHAGVTA